jgi:DNA invertase Pin-like site-specific DNA recombinase
MGKTKRAAMYLRVSTDGQTVQNQRRVLETVAERRGWPIVAIYEDNGISGAKGRDSRPGFNAMLNDATRRRFDVLLFWSIDRLGRSTAMVSTALAELEAAGVAIYADKEGVDATTAHGRAMLQMAAVFAELERAMIRERVLAGLACAKGESPEQRRQRGKKAIGRPRTSAKVEGQIRDQLAVGLGIVKVAKKFGVGVGTVHRIKRAMEIPTHS